MIEAETPPTVEEAEYLRARVVALQQRVRELEAEKAALINVSEAMIGKVYDARQS